MRALFNEPGPGRATRPATGYHQVVIETALLATPLFSGLAPAHMAKLVAMGWVKALAQGEPLFMEGEPSRGIYVVQSGAIRLFRVNPRGDEQVIHIARPRESFGEESLFAASGHHLNASAVKPTRVIVLPRNEFMALLRSCPELLMRLTLTLSHHLCEMITLLDDLRLKSARVRLGHWLLQQCPHPHRPEPQTVIITIPKKVAAAELGMASETFSRVLAELQQQDYISVRGRTVLLRNAQQLQASLAQEEQLSPPPPEPFRSVANRFACLQSLA